MLSALILSGFVGMAGMSNISGGEFRPLYLRADSALVEVDAFSMDQLPVTNAEFLEFVSEYPRYRKGTIPEIFADSRYLEHWHKEGVENTWFPAEDILNNSVVNVSWFAASAYCNSMGKELPSISQWEFAAMASESSKNGVDDPAFTRQILDWYAQHNDVSDLEVGTTEPNYWGIHDMHGLIWEWTKDFNSLLVSGESRADSAIDRQLYCAAGSVGTADPGDYAAFMRYGFRSSLMANFSLPNLGFRCVSSNGG